MKSMMVVLFLAVLCSRAAVAQQKPKALDPPAGPGLFELRGAYELTAPKDPEYHRARARIDEAAGGNPVLVFPLPLADREQAPLTFEVKVEPATALKMPLVREVRPGKWVCEVEVAAPEDQAVVKVEWKSVVLCGARDFSKVPATAPYPKEWPAEVRAWLAATKYVEAENKRIVAIATDLRQGAGDDVLAVIRAAIEKARTIIAGESGRSEEQGAVEALTREGSSASRANLMAAFLRACGIPARILAGYPSWSGPLQTHYIVEAFVPGFGWYPIEPTRLVAPWDAPGLIAVALVSPDDENAGVARIAGSGGVPYLSVTEYRAVGGFAVPRGAVPGSEGCDHVAKQIQRFEERSSKVWGPLIDAAQTRWTRWLLSKPGRGTDGMIATPLTAASLAGITDPAALKKKLGK